MFVDALIVLLEVCVILALVIAILWGLAKVAGYVAMVFEGEPLIPGIRRDLAMTRRQLLRRRRPAGVGRPNPSA